MALSDNALSCAKQLMRVNAAGTAITDLEAEIKAEIGHAIREYNRKPWAMTEVRGMQLETVAGTSWYSSVDVSAGAGDQATSGRTAVDVNTVLQIHYAREATNSTLEDSLLIVPYEQFERLFEGVSPQSSPSYITLYAGQLGLYPTPDAAYTIYLSGTVKPVIPTADSDTSIWLTEAPELIEAAACKRVAAKYTRNAGDIARFSTIEAVALEAFETENLLKRSTGRLKANW